MYHQIYNRSTGTTVARFGVTNSRIFLIPLYVACRFVKFNCD